jgi:hypothetical protein
MPDGATSQEEHEMQGNPPSIESAEQSKAQQGSSHRHEWMDVLQPIGLAT